MIKNKLIKGTIINSINGDTECIASCFDKVLVGKELVLKKKRTK